MRFITTNTQKYLVLATLGWVLTTFSHLASADLSQCKQVMIQRLNVINQKLKNSELEPINLSSDGATLSINGEINAAMAARFAAIPESQKTKIKFVVLNSPGGQVISADPIAKWVSSRFNSIKVVVPSDGICASACTTIYKCAWNRTAAPDAYLLFHPVSMNQEGKSQLKQKWGAGIGDFVGDAIANAATQENENDECSKADQSSGTKTISKEVLKGKEFCYSAVDLNKNFPNYLEVEGARGLLDDVPTSPGSHVIRPTPGSR